MSNELTEYKMSTAIRFEDFGLVDPAERLIQGEIMRCVDGKWSSKGGTEFPHGTRMIVAATARALQRWEDGLPAETIVETPGQSLPDIDELNAATDRNRWDDDVNGNPRPPWQKQYVVYLCDPRDVALYTFLNATKGAKVAVEMLESRIARMRAFSGRHVAAVVELGERLVSKRFGKLGPMFHIVDWLPLDGGSTAAPRQIEHAAAQLEHLAAEQPGRRKHRQRSNCLREPQSAA